MMSGMLRVRSSRAGAGELDTRHAGQHPVEQDQVGQGVADDALGGFGVGGPHHMVAGPHQVGGDEFLDGGLVFDEQDRGGHQNLKGSQDGRSVLQLLEGLMTGHRLQPGGLGQAGRLLVSFGFTHFQRRNHPWPASQGRSRPTEIKLHQRSRLMEVAFDDGQRFEFSFEFLRVFPHPPKSAATASARKSCSWASATWRSPASSRWATMPSARSFRTATTAACIRGITSTLGENHDDLWQTYLLRLAEAGGSRDPAEQAPPSPAPAAAVTIMIVARHAAPHRL
jgi:DUF971 family protein